MRARARARSLDLSHSVHGCTLMSVAECIDRLGYTNPAALAACIEAMIINGTP
ncbi:MAG: hypothetical protein KF817_15025 [Phycisphaeraceae bacterium]|nr:hypothetical protein [Phycisphaeraceae bacterium]